MLSFLCHLRLKDMFLIHEMHLLSLFVIKDEANFEIV